MKKLFCITLFVALIVTGFNACRSAKNAPVAEPVQPEEVEAQKWDNVTFPVRVNILQPMSFTLNGTATMVRDKYIYVSMRMLGFEVAQFYVTPDELDVVMKQPQKMWIQEQIGDRLQDHGISLLTLQEALLGERSAQSKLPQTLQCGGTDDLPIFRVQTKIKNTQVDMMLECRLEDLHINVAGPADFKAPTGIAKTTIQKASTVLGK